MNPSADRNAAAQTGASVTTVAGKTDTPVYPRVIAGRYIASQQYQQQHLQESPRTRSPHHYLTVDTIAAV